MSFKVILWPTDDSAPSLKALQSAAEMAVIHKAVLHGLQAINPLPPLAQSGTGFAPAGTAAFNVPLYEKELVGVARKKLEKTMAEKVPEKINASVEVRVGEPHEIINEFVREKNVDLIVMATHGRTGLSHLLLGSVAEKVIRNSPVPVLTVPVDTE